MRSIALFLRGANEAALTAYLDRSYPGQRQPWVLSVNGDTRLYIDVVPFEPEDFEPEELADFATQFGDLPPCYVVAHVSGRHAGEVEVVQFIEGLFTEFRGVAMDEYTSHLWSLDEIKTAHRFKNHPFFDYNGWHLQSRSAKADPAG
jgi:hypothetical protein